MSGRPLSLVLLFPLALICLAWVPPVGAHVPLAAGPAQITAAPPPLSGTVTGCSSRVTCVFAFNATAGTGWANATATTGSGLEMALQLPGEAKASYHLAYSTYIARLTGTYTYWTVGSFLGTDVNSGHVVYGTTNTNYTITCHGHSGRGGGCTYTYTTDNGTIVVHFTNAAQTTTSISCSPTSTSPGGKVSCGVTVTNDWNALNYPTGNVSIKTGRTGSLSDKGVCPLVNGSCSFVYRPFDNTCGNVVLSANYLGKAAFYKSSASTTIAVIVSGGC